MRLDCVSREQLPDLSDVHLHGVAQVARQLLAPDRLRQSIERDDFPGGQPEHSQKRPLLAGRQTDGLAVDSSLERPSSPTVSKAAGATLGVVTDSPAKPKNQNRLTGS